jgi:transketolase
MTKAPERTYSSVLRELATADPRIVVVTAENRAAIRDLPDVLGDRFLDVGICEQTMIGMAAGMALRGRIPVVHALATFLTLRAFEFIRDDVGIAGLPVKLVGGVPGFLSDANGPTHQAIEDIALMRAIPGMQVVCPADESELLAGLPAVLASPAPTYIRFNSLRSELTHTPFELGRAELLTEGHDLAVLAAGLLVPQVKAAADMLREEGIGVRVTNLRTIVPIDEQAILAAARACGRVAVVEDHLLAGGIYQVVCEVLVRHQLVVPVIPIGLDGRWFRPALLPDVLDREGFSAPRLAERFRRACSQVAPAAWSVPARLAAAERLDGNPGRVPGPSRDDSAGQSPAPSTRSAASGRSPS